MAQIFISYSRVDSAFVERLIQRIQLAFPDLTIWHDQSPHGLIGGDEWWNEILRAIAASTVFVYVLSNESVQSRYCQAEFTEARRLQKRIITVQARDRTALRDGLEDIHFIDMKNGPDDAEALMRLVAAISKQLRLARDRRPLWTPATPKPLKEEPSTRSVTSPPIDTAPLTPPTIELETRRKVRNKGFRPVVGIVIGALLIGISFLAILADNPAPLISARTDTITPMPIIPAVADVPSPTMTDPPLASPEPSLSIVEIVATLDDQATAAARATAYAVQTITQAWIDSWTATPTFTPTNTPNMTATINTFLTQRAATATQAWIDSWTDTSTPTPTPTPDPLRVALIAARTFTGGNADWQARYPDGFQHAFDDGVPMVLVPAGCFIMGSDEGALDERPVHEQCFAQPFWIDRTEVTQGQFAALGGVAGRPSYFSGGRRPVEQITWFEARDFCARRGARLPTEAEWEYAARGPDGWIYPWGNTFVESNVVWNRDTSQGTANVGSTPPGASWVGALDMIGNVWEWTSSLYRSYPYDAADGREADTGSRTDALRVLRGASWYSFYTTDSRAAFRLGYYANRWSTRIGFRCARSS